MPRQRLPASLIAGRVLLLLAFISGVAYSCRAERRIPSDPHAGIPYLPSRGQRLEMTVNTSQVLKSSQKRRFRRRVPLRDPKVVQATPLAADQVQIAAWRRA